MAAAWMELECRLGGALRVCLGSREGTLGALWSVACGEGENHASNCSTGTPTDGRH